MTLGHEVDRFGNKGPQSPFVPYSTFKELSYDEEYLIDFLATARCAVLASR
jgi:hypothetical protein